MTMNIFALADDNTSSLQARFEEAKAKTRTDELAVVERFADHVLRTSQVSINMRPSVLSRLIAKGQFQNTYEHAQELSEREGKPVDSALRDRLAGFHDRRLAFDDAFEDGRSFRYGALNIGGAGAVKYGGFCCVLSSGFPANVASLAYLKHDSLKIYVGRDGAVKKGALAQDVATHGSRHHLAALKHVDGIASVPEEEWAKLLCSNEDYMEAIFLGKLTRDEFDEVRIPVDEYDRLWELAFDDIGQPLEDAGSESAEDFNTILRAARDKLIDLKRV